MFSSPSNSTLTVNNTGIPPDMFQDPKKLYLGVSLLQLYTGSLDYSNNCIPLFHRPTLKLEV
jgi:hypothetical protein